MYDAMKRTLLVLALLLSSAGLTAAQGQPLRKTGHTLSIEAGTVYIDGEAVPAHELPASLDVDEVELQFEFHGIASPVVEIDGTPYVIEGRRLREVRAGEGDDVAVFFRGRAPRPEAPPPPANVFYRPDVTLVREHAEELQRRAARMQEVEAASQVVRTREMQQWAAQVQQQAEQVARAAEELPQREAALYLSEVQQQDRGLYQRLVREWELEASTRRLADALRALPAGPQRDARLGELRDRLDEIFELKQQNRRDEIDQLERQLDALQRRLAEREAQRRRIVEQRLRQLLDGLDP